MFRKALTSSPSSARIKLVAQILACCSSLSRGRPIVKREAKRGRGNSSNGQCLSLEISAHALGTFRDRYREIYGRELSDPAKCIHLYFSKAREVKRRGAFYLEIKHGKSARYFINHSWCFVVDAYQRVLITIYPLDQFKKQKFAKLRT